MILNEKEREVQEVSLSMARKQNKGKGWEEVRAGRDLFDYAFKCKDCGALLEGFVVSPKFCPHCGKEHG